MTSSNDAQNVTGARFKQEPIWDIVTEEKLHSGMCYLPDTLSVPQPVPCLKCGRQHQSTSAIFTPIKRPVIFSFFSGAGFLDLGFESNGFKVAYTNEFYSPFLEAYRYARNQLNIASPEYGYHEGSAVDLAAGKGKNHLSDLVRDARKNADVIGFIGGPPCPDFSVGGKNRGREGDNGKLSETYIELICSQQPDFYLFENVKGLWQTKRHRAFYEEIKQKTQKDYVTTECLTNAIEYGAPQDRNRIVLLGFRKDFLHDLGIEEDSVKFFPWKSHTKYLSKEIFTSPWPSTNTFEENSKIDCVDGVIQELTVEHWFEQNDVLNHQNAEQYFKPRAGMKRFTSVLEGDDSKKSFKRLHRWRYSPTAAYGNNEVHLHPYKIRRISVAEAMAIQSLPKNFTFPSSMTLTDAFKAVGNGVPYAMSNALAQTILDFLRGV